MTQTRLVRACGAAPSASLRELHAPARGCDSDVRAGMARRARQPVRSVCFRERCRRAALLTGRRVCGTCWLSVMHPPHGSHTSSARAGARARGAGAHTQCHSSHPARLLGQPCRCLTALNRVSDLSHDISTRAHTVSALPRALRANSAPVHSAPPHTCLLHCILHSMKAPVAVPALVGEGGRAGLSSYVAGGLAGNHALSCKR